MKKLILILLLLGSCAKSPMSDGVDGKDGIDAVSVGSRKVYQGIANSDGSLNLSVSEIDIDDMPVISIFYYSSVVTSWVYFNVTTYRVSNGQLTLSNGSIEGDAPYRVVVVK
jgi:hypothetical protein